MPYKDGGAAGGDRERERFKEGGEEVYRCDSEEVENVKHFDEL